MTRRPNGLEVGRVRTPIGVIGIIYESRPNVTADAAGLCLKSGNAILLRGGKRPSIPTAHRQGDCKGGLPSGHTRRCNRTGGQRRPRSGGIYDEDA